jgi:8-oxo-dGTP diphosphatase
MRFTPVVGTLAYLLDPTTDQVLIIRRNARPNDDHFGKVNGLGGKVEVDEDIVSSARREVLEESGLSATDMQLRGTVTFSDFGPKREQWLVFIFLVTDWTGLQQFSYLCGRETSTSCRLSSTTTRAAFTGLCPTTAIFPSAGPTSASD